MNGYSLVFLLHDTLLIDGYIEGLFDIGFLCFPS
jgi:hypothetical protein